MLTQWTDDDDKLPGYVTDGGQQTSSTRTREDRANGLLEVWVSKNEVNGKNA